MHNVDDKYETIMKKLEESHKATLKSSTKQAEDNVSLNFFLFYFVHRIDNLFFFFLIV